MNIWQPGENENVDDQLMEDWLVAVWNSQARGVSPLILLATLCQLVTHLSAGGRMVVRADTHERAAE